MPHAGDLIVSKDGDFFVYPSVLQSYGNRRDPGLMLPSVEAKAGVPVYPLRSQEPTLYR